MTQVTWSGGVEHWTHKGDVKLFLWEKQRAPGPERSLQHP